MSRATHLLLSSLSLALAVGCQRSQSEPAPAASARSPATSAPATSAAPPPAAPGEPWIVASGACHRLRAYPLPGGTLVFGASHPTRSSSLHLIDGSGAPKDVSDGLPDLGGSWMESVEIYGRWPDAAWLVSEAGIFAHRGSAWEKMPEQKGFRGAADWTNGRVVTFDAALQIKLIDGAAAPDLPKAPRNLFCAGYSHPWRSDVIASDRAGDLFILGGCPAFGSDPWGHNRTRAALLILPKDDKARWELPPGEGPKFPSGFGVKVWARSASEVYVGGMMVEKESSPFGGMPIDFYLARFDGARWTRISAPTDDRQMVLHMAGDDTGALWVATQAGLFTWKDGAWTERALPPASAGSDASRSSRLYPQSVDVRDGTPWISAGDSPSSDGNGVGENGWIVNVGGKRHPPLACDVRNARPALVAR